jgi:hypothetical protein
VVELPLKKGPLIVEMSVEIIFRDFERQQQISFRDTVHLTLIGINYISFSELQEDMLNHSAFQPFPERLVVKP